MNSFSWEFFVKAFLQDIIQPPILPKIIEKASQTQINANFGKLLFKGNSTNDNIHNFIKYMYDGKINAPDITIEKAKKKFIMILL